MYITKNESSQSVKLNQSEECEIDTLLNLPPSHNYWSLVTRDLSPGPSLHKLSTNHIKCLGQLEQLAPICPPRSVLSADISGQDYSDSSGEEN